MSDSLAFPCTTPTGRSDGHMAYAAFDGDDIICSFCGDRVSSNTTAQQIGDKARFVKELVRRLASQNLKIRIRSSGLTHMPTDGTLVVSAFRDDGSFVDSIYPRRADAFKIEIESWKKGCYFILDTMTLIDRIEVLRQSVTQVMSPQEFQAMLDSIFAHAITLEDRLRIAETKLSRIHNITKEESQ